MTLQEAQQALGTSPEGSQFIQGYQVVKFSLHRPWVGMVPHYLAFDGQTGKLVAWKENMSEYYATQQLWISTMPQKHEVEITGNVNQTITGPVEHNVTIRKKP